MIKGFGLPSDTDSCFYNEFLSEERDTRIRIGENKLKTKSGKVNTTVKSLNIFIQSLWLYNVPVVHECGKWIEYLPDTIASYAAYAMSRLSQFIDYGHEPDFEREVAISRANAVAYEFSEIFDLPDEEMMEIFDGAGCRHS